MRLRAHRADAVDLAQPLRIGLDDVEDLLAEGLHHLLGIDRADAADHAGGEVLLDPLRRGGRRGLQKPRLELLAMGAVVEPFARGRDPFARRDRGGMSDHRDEVAVPARLDAQHAEAVLVIVEGHALDDAGQHLLRCLLGLCGGDCGSLVPRPPVPRHLEGARPHAAAGKARLVFLRDVIDSILPKRHRPALLRPSRH